MRESDPDDAEPAPRSLSDNDIATTLDDVQVFLDDPVALIERALDLLRVIAR